MHRRYAFSTESWPWTVMADPDSERVVVALEHATEIWDPASGTRLRRVEGPFDPKLVQDRVAVIAGRKDGALHFVPLDPDAPIVSGQPTGRLGSNVLPLGDGFVGGDWDGRVAVFDGRGAIVRRFEPRPGAPARLVLLDRDRVLVHGSNVPPRVVRLEDGAIERTLATKEGELTDTVHLVGREHALVYGAAHRAGLYSLETGKKIWRRVKTKGEANAGAVLWGHYVMGNRNGLYLVDLATGALVAQIGTLPIDLLVPLADGRLLALTDDSRGIAVFGESGLLDSVPSAHGAAMVHACAHPTQPRAITWAFDHTVAIWDL